jgi:pimeloyl-ACP methyl ester carboxylesterase
MSLHALKWRVSSRHSGHAERSFGLTIMPERIPLLLIPGLLCDGALWRHQAEHLAELAQIQIADVTQQDSVAAMADAVLAMTPGRFALAGLSMGGYVALEIMRRAPERVIRLALLDSSARPETAKSRARRLGFMDQAERGDFKGVTGRLLPLLVHPDRLGDAALTGEIMAMSLRVGKEAYLRQQKAIIGRPDGRARLGEITATTLVLVGRQDALTPLDLHEEMAARIPHARLVVVERSGHLTTMEQPEAVTAIMRYWLQA